MSYSAWDSPHSKEWCQLDAAQGNGTSTGPQVQVTNRLVQTSKQRGGGAVIPSRPRTGIQEVWCELRENQMSSSMCLPCWSVLNDLPPLWKALPWLGEQMFVD